MSGDLKELGNTHLSEKERTFLDAVKKGDLCDVKQSISEVNVNCTEEDGMTALMFASYKGKPDMIEYLLTNGASPNHNSHKDGYTPLMFATLAGSTDCVRILLEAGAKTDFQNKVNRTASQLGAFVGRHDCVSLINNFVEQDHIKYYTKMHGLEKQPKLKEHIAGSLHKYMMIPNLNPVKMLLFLQGNKDLVANEKSVIDVMEAELQKAYKAVNEILSLKLHFLCSVFRKAVAWENGSEGKGGLEGLIKYLVRGRSADGFLVNIETVLRNSIKSFPYAKSNIFQQLVKTLSKVEIGKEPSALSAITQSLNGIQSADFSECCECCGERHSMNKCSVCKSVRYCSLKCQKLHWSTHKSFCKELKKQYDVMQEEKLNELQAEEALQNEANLKKMNIESENYLDGNENEIEK